MKRNNSCKPITSFCFRKEMSLANNQRNFLPDNETRDESVIFAGTSDLSNINTLNCYTISEASNVVKKAKEMPYPSNDTTIESIDSIYSISYNRIMILLRSLQEEKIIQCSFDPFKGILQVDQSPIFYNKNANSRISFFFPMYDETSKSYKAVYSVDNKIFIDKIDITPTVNLPSKAKLNCAAYISNNSLAIGVGSDLYLYNIRTKFLRKEQSVHIGNISTISVNRLDTNILYTGGCDGIVKQFDIRQWTDINQKLIPVYEVCCGSVHLPQCPVVHIAPNPRDKSVFAAVSSGNATYGYVRIFKDGITKYLSKPSEPLKSKLSQEELFISATTQNKASWIEWSNVDPSLLVSVDINGEFRTHYFTDLDFDGMLAGL